MKKRNVRFFICGIAKLSVSVFFFLTAAFISKDLKSQTPFAVELYHTQGLGISMAQAAPFTVRGGFAAASVGENVQVAVGEGSKSIPAYYQMATPNYGAYANLRLIEGEYFSDDVSEGHVVVIPESLAKELPADGSGEKALYINGTEYAVCGVYADGGILTQLGSAKTPVIYGNMSENPDILAGHFLIGADAGKTAQQQKQEIIAMMEIPLEGEINDLGRLHQLGDDILLLGFFFASLWFVLHSCIVSYRKFISAYESKGNAAQRAYTAFFAAAVLLFTAIGFAFLLQLVRIPAIYLPENNIFDIPYYGRQILDGIQQISTDCRIKDFSRISAVYLFAETGCAVLAVLFFWSGCQKLRHGFADGNVDAASMI